MVLRNRLTALFAGCAMTTASGVAHAQGTGTVASPVIKPGATLSIASGLAFDDGQEGFAQRIDYRVAVAKNVRLSAIAFANNRGGGFRYRRLALETMFQFQSSDRGWNSAIQFRGRIPDGNDGPGRLRVAWLNRWRPTDKTDLRFIVLAAREFGEDRRQGVALETRAEATWRLSADVRVGGQIFNRYNTTADFGSFDSQRHAIGGVVKGPLTERISYRINALAGVSEAAPDVELRARLRMPL